MSLELKNKLIQLREESSNFNQNDLLVHAPVDSAKVVLIQNGFSFNLNDFPKSILNEAKKTASETGVNSLCATHGIVHLTYKEKLVQTPFFITPVSIQINKIQQLISFEKMDEDVFVNPFVVNFLKQQLGKEIDEALLESCDMEVWQHFLTENGIEDIDWVVELIGNFHHHRYQVVRELQELYNTPSYSTSLRQILGETLAKDVEFHKLYSGNIFPADTDHENVFGLIQTNNVVIQGPPGTGKSQVLANILGKTLYSGKSTLVLSEKRSALEVLRKRLGEHQLDTLCFISTADSLSKELLNELRTSWEFLSNSTSTKTNLTSWSEQYEANLQMLLDLLNQPDLIGGISFAHYSKLTDGLNLTKVAYKSRVPTISNFLSNESFIEKIYRQNWANTVTKIKPWIYRNEIFSSLDLKLEKWVSDLISVQSILPFETWEELNRTQNLAIDFQIFENDLVKKLHLIFQPNSKEQKHFLQLRKKKNRIEKQVEILEENDGHWKIQPSKSDLKIIDNQLSIKGFFQRKKARNVWQKFSNLPIEFASDSIRLKEQIFEKKDTLSQLSIDFCEIGVENGEIEIDQIALMIPDYTTERWEKYMKTPVAIREEITRSHEKINRLISELKDHFEFKNSDNIISVINQFLVEFNQLLLEKSSLTNLDESTVYLLGKATTFEEFKSLLYKSHWVKLQEQFPSLAEFSIETLKQKVDQIINIQTSESALLASSIKEQIFDRFQEANKLLNTPSQKLTADQKTRKAQLKKGKSILVKEFAKTRNHPSIRSLFNSEAKDWIQLLKPIWLSNPVQLAKCFPLEEDLFDFCVFDEASQIPLQNALGGIQRSKRVIVAGDDQQMGPSFYFKSGGDEVVDLLHQANFYFNKSQLHHHYRSSHPDLIRFSNTHFYQNKLEAFPSSKRSENPIQLHYVSDATFIDRRNEKEAKEVAAFISTKLINNIQFGVVAFSEEQLSAIWQKLKASDQQKLSEQIENNVCFFKAIENVQGDECDELIISFGYAKNELGEFALRFGPMNKQNGRRRLNVLLTRARNEIHFFTSVKSTDFKVTDNESVELITKWFRFIETYAPNSDINFPFDAKPIVNGEQLTLKSIYISLHEARELVNYHRVLENLGWSLKYTQ